MEPTLPNKEYGIGEILSESWKKFLQNYQLILKITLLIYIPINIILFFVPAEALLAEMGTARGIRTYMKIIQLLEGLIGIIATMAIMYLIKQNIDGKPVGLKEALKKSLSRWPAVIGTHIMSGIFLIGLTLLFIVPGIIYSLYWMFIIPVVILYGKSGMAALRHSKEIVEGRWWQVFGYVLVFGILTILVSLGFGAAEGTILSFLPENLITNILEISLDSLGDFVMAYFTVVTTIYFINLDSTKKVKTANANIPTTDQITNTK